MIIEAVMLSNQVLVLATERGTAPQGRAHQFVSSLCTYSATFSSRRSLRTKWAMKVTILIRRGHWTGDSGRYEGESFVRQIIHVMQRKGEPITNCLGTRRRRINGTCTSTAACRMMMPKRRYLRNNSSEEESWWMPPICSQLVD